MPTPLRFAVQRKHAVLGHWEDIALTPQLDAAYGIVPGLRNQFWGGSFRIVRLSSIDYGTVITDIIEESL